jgi:hypothetical protein
MMLLETRTAPTAFADGTIMRRVVGLEERREANSTIVRREAFALLKMFSRTSHNPSPIRGPLQIKTPITLQAHSPRTLYTPK